MDGRTRFRIKIRQLSLRFSEVLNKNFSRKAAKAQRKIAREEEIIFSFFPLRLGARFLPIPVMSNALSFLSLSVSSGSSVVVWRLDAQPNFEGVIVRQFRQQFTFFSLFRRLGAA
jgi:hypothetical protein